jgi:hypothetical protein
LDEESAGSGSGWAVEYEGDSSADCGNFGVIQAMLLLDGLEA